LISKFGIIAGPFEPFHEDFRARWRDQIRYSLPPVAEKCLIFQVDSIVSADRWMRGLPFRVNRF
jgi:hypothetical protein